VIWVNLTAGSTELNIAYGNPSATKSAYENARLTFIFFDDFDGTSLDSIWQPYGTPTVSVQNGYLRIGLQDATEGIYARVSYSNVIIEWIGRKSGGTDNDFVIFAGVDAPTSGARGYTFHHYGWGNAYVRIYRDFWAVTQLASASDSAPTDWTVFENIIADGKLIIKKNGVEILSAIDSTYTQFNYIGIHTWSDSQWDVDRIIIKKLADPAEFGTPSVRRNSYVVILLQNPSQATLENFYVRIQTEDGNNYVYKLNETLNPGEIKALQIANITGKPVKVEVQAENCPVSAEKVLG
jgi:hypothetical protein